MTVTQGGNTPPPEPGDAAHGFAGLKWEPAPPPGGWATVWRLVLPIVGVVVGFGFILLTFEPDRAQAFLTFAGVYVLPFGIDFGVPTGVALGLSPWSLVAIVAYFDAWITLFWIWNLDHLTRFDRIHRWVDASVQKAQDQFDKRPWLGRATLPGLTLFVFIPLYGTGSFTGIVLGKLIAMRPVTIWAASMLGTAARVAVLGFGTAGALGIFG